MTAPSVSLGPRTVIASVSNYAEAQQLVDTLADRNFPVEHVDLVGSDLHLVEHVIGRLTTARAALGGAISGAWLGLLIGLVFWIVTPWTRGPVPIRHPDRARVRSPLRGTRTRLLFGQAGLRLAPNAGSRQVRRRGGRGARR